MILKSYYKVKLFIFPKKKINKKKKIFFIY